MTEFVHDFSSHAPTTPDELKKNEQETAEIQNHASVAAVWLNLCVGGFKNAQGVKTALGCRNIRFVGRASLVLDQVSFPGFQREVKLAVVSGTDIGFHENRPYTNNEWRARFLQRGYKFPSAESIVCARMYPIRLDAGRSYVAMMDPISVAEDGKRIELLFVLSSWSGVEDLSTAYGDDDYSWYPEQRFIVEIP